MHVFVRYHSPIARHNHGSRTGCNSYLFYLSKVLHNKQIQLCIILVRAQSKLRMMYADSWNNFTYTRTIKFILATDARQGWEKVKAVGKK